MMSINKKHWKLSFSNSLQIPHVHKNNDAQSHIFKGKILCQKLLKSHITMSLSSGWLNLGINFEL